MTCHFRSWTSHPIVFSLPAISRLGRLISCGKFVFPSHYLPLPILEVPCHVVNLSSHLSTCTSHDLPLPILDVPSSVVNSSSNLITCHSRLGRLLVVNSSSHLITCHFPSWTSHLLVVNSSSHLITCHFPSWTSHLLVNVVNSSSHLITCHFPSWKSHVYCGKICLPISYPTSHLGRPILSSHLTSHLGRPISFGKFVFPCHYLPLPILDVPSPVATSSSHLITCHFPSWTSNLCGKICLPIMSGGKFVFPNHCLPLPILEVPCHVVTSSSHLITCHFPSWTSHLL